MRKWLILALLLSACEASTTPALDCSDQPASVQPLCRAVDLIHDNYVDAVEDVSLAAAAQRALAELPDATGSNLVCPLSDPVYEGLCETLRRKAGADPSTAVATAVEGIVVNSLDVYSAYLSPDLVHIANEDRSGAVVGIGAIVNARTVGGDDPCSLLGDRCNLVIASVIADSPAEKAGMQQGDLLLAVDGATVNGLTVDEVTVQVRGEAGTSVSLLVSRDGQRQTIELIRATVDFPVVEAGLVKPGIGVIRLHEFTDDAPEEFRQELLRLLDAGAVRLILDLRDNPGGSLNAAVDIASEFFDTGEVVETVSPQQRKVYFAEEDGVATHAPLLVLINGGSASASEVVAAVLQERGRATLIGQPSFGKNTVQQQFDLGDGSVLRLTIARWVTPGGHDFGGDGVAPDIEQTETGDEDDPILAKALELFGV